MGPALASLLKREGALPEPVTTLDTWKDLPPATCTFDEWKGVLHVCLTRKYPDESPDAVVPEGWDAGTTRVPVARYDPMNMQE
jgi:hypothetical protein